MGRVRAEKLVLIADGKEIELKNPSRKNIEINKALQDPAKFREFAIDPAKFLAGFDIRIDPEVSRELIAKLAGMSNLDDAKKLLEDNISTATIWAVAAGAYSTATGKILIAF